uniref:Uncharacterized protein n=1 Tax=Tanacetum cinerariifolium TaxID=118510 RepID=A0A6L2JTB1_TANCI|nr:hypothetical protein [Tanacetum cinerariifolium]
MRRVGKRFPGVATPLFEGMLIAGEPEEQGDVEEQVQDNVNDAAQGADTDVSGDDVQDQSIPSPTPLIPPHQQPQDLPSTSQEALDACAAFTRRVEHLEHDKRIESSVDTDMEDASNQGRMITDLDRDTGVALMDDEGTKKKAKDAQVAGHEQVKRRQAEIYQIDMDHASKVLSMQEDKPEEHEAVEVVTTGKLITELVAAVSELVTAASATTAAVLTATITAAIVRVAAASTKRRKGVVIRDPEEESTAIIPAKTKSKDKGKRIMVEEPKPIKKKQQVKMDEEYARKLHEELNKDIDWSVAINHVKKKAKEDLYVQRYQVMKKRPQTEAQARRNMIMYLKNTRWTRSSLEESKECPWSSKELSDAKQKLMLLDSAAERRLILLSQDKTVNDRSSRSIQIGTETSDHNSLELGIYDHINEPSSSKLVLKVVPLADKTVTLQQELEFLFSPIYEEYFIAGN